MENKISEEDREIAKRLITYFMKYTKPGQFDIPFNWLEDEPTEPKQNVVQPRVSNVVKDDNVIVLEDDGNKTGVKTAEQKTSGNDFSLTFERCQIFFQILD